MAQLTAESTSTFFGKTLRTHEDKRREHPYRRKTMTDVTRSLRVLIVEDSENDALLLLRLLAKNGFVTEHERVQTREDMRRELIEKRWDIIVADYSMPQFSGLEALQLVQELEMDLPFIIMSGTVGENVAVQAMKAGAHDYIMKDNMIRLVPAIERELKEVQVRRGTRRIETERQLLATAIEQARETIMITDAKGRIEYVNPAFEDITGYSRQDVMGKNPAMLSSGKHNEGFYKELWETLRQGNTWRGCFINQRKDAALYHEEAVISPVRDEAGQVAHYVAVKRDVTKEDALADQLRQSQKMEALGHLAGQVAHDFTNTLVIILNSCHIIKNCIPQDSEAQEFLDKILEQGNKISALTCQLLAFSHRQPVAMKPMNLEKIVMGVSETLERMVGVDVSVIMTGSPGRKMINADPSQVEQVLFHLVVNARDAMEIGGSLRIQTGVTHVTDAPHPELVAGATLVPGDYIWFTVSDTGVGMDMETQRKVFDPFFTTKGKGGSGLGLSTAYGIVKQHKGYIGVRSEQGKGTTFTVYFPLLHDEEKD